MTDWRARSLIRQHKEAVERLEAALDALTELAQQQHADHAAEIEQIHHDLDCLKSVRIP